MALDPYAPPGSDLNAPTVQDIVPSSELVMASRLARLLAAIVDVFVILPFTFGMMFILPEFFIGSGLGETFGPIMRTIGLAGVLIGAPLLALQARRYLATGQSFGKAAAGIKVVRADGGIPNMQTLMIRVMLFTALSYIPVIGGLISLVDTLAILGSEKLCLHDRAAQTKVVIA
jgi:uncharacterized RDD family membrane protein YckC